MSPEIWGKLQGKCSFWFLDLLYATGSLRTSSIATKNNLKLQTDVLKDYLELVGQILTGSSPKHEPFGKTENLMWISLFWSFFIGNFQIDRTPSSE